MKPHQSLDQQIHLMPIGAPEYAGVGHNSDQLDGRLVAALAKLALVRLRASLVVASPAVFIHHRHAAFWTFHGRLLVRLVQEIRESVQSECRRSEVGPQKVENPMGERARRTRCQGSSKQVEVERPHALGKLEPQADAADGGFEGAREQRFAFVLQLAGSRD